MDVPFRIVSGGKTERTPLPLLPSKSLTTASLFQHTINLILILNLQRLGGIIICDPIPVEEESDGGAVDSFALGVGIHDFLHFGCLFDFEVSFFSILDG